nr:MAG TPA: phosphoadenosine-phosphosulfate reductase [Caudoviricetes sp.]
MPSKQYLNIDVYEAAQQRMNYIFNHFDNVLVALSGGKDSSIAFNLAYRYAQKHDQLDKLGIYFVDYEAQYKMTIDYVQWAFDHYKDIKRYWLCLPNSVPSATSMQTGLWIPWEKTKKDIWVRQMPQADYVVNEDNVPWDYNPGTEDYTAQEDFTKWFSSKHGKTAVVIAIRADESMDRFRAIKSHHKIHAYDGKEWLVSKNSVTVNAYPVYDWTVEDIWTANARFGWKYNHLYDLYYQAGMPIHQMRVASPFLSEGLGTLKYYQAIEPNTWAKMLGRVNGVNFAGIYGGTTLMGWKSIKLPKGYTWKEYLKFLLSTLPEQTRKDYQKIFKTSIEFWDKRGGVLDDETIRELQDAGIPLEIKGKTNYHTQKKAVAFHDYPDDAPVTNFRTAPSYKRMCITIMKNDHTAKYMGFSRTKEQQEKRRKAMEKYANIL